MTFEEFNAADEAPTRAMLLRCCGSKRWADGVLARRPFQDREGLLSTADSVWWTLGPGDWLEAFSAHPRIGNRKTTDATTNLDWSSQEQSGVDFAPVQLLQRLAEANQDYEQRFGWTFLVNATGKTASEMLDLLQARLRNGSAEELHIAATEQAKITTLRLNKLLDA